jgi:hypothetical protein
MAVQVGYFEDFHTPEEEAEAYREGPFVIVNANGFRIEAQVVGHKCPAMPDLSVFKLREQWGYRLGKFDRDKATELCDRLNEAVREGKIVLNGKHWMVADAA